MIPEPVSSRSAAENRRFFTRGAVAGLTTPLVATPAALAQGAERVGFAVVGLGSFALNQIIPSFGDARLAALVSGSTDKAGTVGRTFGVAEERRHTYDDFDRIARDPTVRVVHVITPNALHEELVVRAAEVGQASSLREADGGHARGLRADDRGLPRGRPQADDRLPRAVRALQPEGHRALPEGRARQDQARHQQPRPDARPGGPGRPAADVARSRRGRVAGRHRHLQPPGRALRDRREPVEVQSTEGDPRFREVEETCLFQLRFPSGALASCSSSYGQSEVKRIQVMGETASLELDPATDYYERKM
jgi:predicted dehydrogenase